jgi:hypothetical protein
MVATNYYREVIEAAQDFLGPAAERFINRQIEFYLNKPPEKITKADVLKLKDSVKIALGLLIDDQKVIDQAVRKFDKIANR